MPPRRLEPGAEGDDVRVLEQEEKIRHPACTPFLNERTLNLDRAFVRDSPEVTDLQVSHAFRRPSSPSSRSFS
jgi:hypothetical protein